MLADAAPRPSLGAKWRALAPYLGPAFLVSVGYMDPGNWATNIAGGATYGYRLLWVLLLSNGIALLLQALAAKLGIVTGKTLAELCRDEFPRPVVFVLWAIIQCAMLATDLAEFLGAALGFQILFGWQSSMLFPAALITAALVFAILGLQKRGFRTFESVVIAFVAVVGFGYLIEIILARHHIQWAAVAHGVLVPSLPHAPAFAPDAQSSLLVAIGILGATVMPHNLFLHSSIIHTHVGHADVEDKPGEKDAHTQKLVRFALIDSVMALNLAWLVNSAMLIIAAATFYENHLAVDSITVAHRTLDKLLGGLAPRVFGIALLAAGLSSSTTGTLAGQVVMQGFLKRDIPMVWRWLLNMAPALLIIWLMPRLGWGDTKVLVASQVVLSLALPFAVVPLLLFTRRKDLMREHVNKPATNVFAWLCALIVIVLNVLLLWQTFGGTMPG